MNKIGLIIVALFAIFILALAIYNNSNLDDADTGTIAERTLTISPGKIIEKDRAGNISILPDANF